MVILSEGVYVRLRVANMVSMEIQCSHYPGVLFKDTGEVTVTTVSCVGQVRSKLNFIDPVFHWFWSRLEKIERHDSIVTLETANFPHCGEQPFYRNSENINCKSWDEVS